MKHKVKKYAGTDSSLVEIEERSTKSPSVIAEELAKGPMDYATMGKRAGATPARSTMSGPIEYITDSSKEETESDEPRRKITDYSTNKGTTTYLQKEDAPSTVGKITPKKKKAPKYEDTGAKIGNQSFMPSDKERRRQLEMSDKPLESVNPEMYFPPLRGLNALAKGLAGKKAVEEVGKRAGTELSTMVRSPKEILRQAEKDITPRSPRLGNEPLKLGMRKGGSVKKMASGGKVSSASSRGDGIAQRGKTKGRIC